MRCRSLAFVLSLVSAAPAFAAAGALALLLLVAFPARADSLLLSCVPEENSSLRAKAYIDGFARTGGTDELDTFRALVRAGEDEYEFAAEHTKSSSFTDGKLSVHAVQPLSAGETAELKLEGARGKADEPFFATLWLRAENRVATGRVRCTFD